MWLNKKEKDGNCAHVSGRCYTSLMSVKLKFNTVTTADTIGAELSTKKMHRRAADD